jgi:hypothetical protein
VAYGLIEDVADARACGEFADAIVVRPAVAAKLAAQVGAALADEERVLLGSSVGSAP